MKKTGFKNKRDYLNSKLGEAVCHFVRIHSPYIRKVVLKHLDEKKFLSFIKYNKAFLKNVNYSFIDLTRFIWFDSPIVLEIIPVPGASGNFINLYEADKKYIKVFFNDSYFESPTNFITYLIK